MGFRNVAVGTAGGIGALVAVGNNPEVLPQAGAVVAGTVEGVGQTVNTILGGIVPNTYAAAAAPFATAAGAAYLAHNAMNLIGVDNTVARTLGYAGSASLGFVADSAVAPLVLGGAVIWGGAKLGKYLWNKSRNRTATA